jgi:hypothetical protein
MPIFSLTGQKKRVHFFRRRREQAGLTGNRKPRQEQKVRGSSFELRHHVSATRSQPLPSPMDNLEPVTVWIFKEDRIVVLTVLGRQGGTLDILPSRRSNYFTDSIDLFAGADPKCDTSRVWLMPGILCKAKESLARKRFRVRGTPPFTLLTPPHLKAKLRQ